MDEEHPEYGVAAVKLRNWLDEHHMTRYQFGSIIGATDNFMYRCLNYLARPEGRRMLIIEALTGIKVSDWFPSGFMDPYINRFQAYSQIWEEERRAYLENPDLPRRYGDYSNTKYPSGGLDKDA